MPVRLKGAIDVRKAMRDFEPSLAKETTKELASFLKPVVKKARGYLPSNADAPSGWLYRPTAQGRWSQRFYDKTDASKGITYKTSPSKENRRGFTNLVSIINKDYGGAIFETAGRKSGITGNFTPHLGGKLVGHGQKMTGRAMFRAYDEDQGKAKAGVIKAIEKSAREFNAKVGR